MRAGRMGKRARQQQHGTLPNSSWKEAGGKRACQESARGCSKAAARLHKQIALACTHAAALQYEHASVPQPWQPGPARACLSRPTELRSCSISSSMSSVPPSMLICSWSLCAGPGPPNSGCRAESPGLQATAEAAAAVSGGGSASCRRWGCRGHKYTMITPAAPCRPREAPRAQRPSQPLSTGRSAARRTYWRSPSHAGGAGGGSWPPLALQRLRARAEFLLSLLAVPGG